MKTAMLGVLLILSAACEGPSVKLDRKDEELARSLAGAWNAHLTVTSLPYLNRSAASYGAIDGQMVLLGNKSVREKFPGVRSVTNYGSYQLDFARLGLELSPVPVPPTLVAGRMVQDSIEIILDPARADAVIRLVGSRTDPATIKGRWIADIDRVGEGRGQFVLTRAR